MEVEKVQGFTLGSIIAFVAPGFIAFVALAHKVSAASDWLAHAESAENNVGVFLFVALASLALGIVVSGIRALVFDPLCKQDIFGLDPIVLDPPDFFALKDDSVRAAFVMMVESYYRYYQFYANTFVALAIWWALHLTDLVGPMWGGRDLVLAFALVALFFSARDSLKRLSIASRKLFSTGSEATNEQRHVRPKSHF